MDDGHEGGDLRRVRMLLQGGAVGDLADGELLRRFAAGGGSAAESAFEALVERHGPMVLRVCRATLGDPDGVDDAFQATFLVLVRRAGSLWVRDSLGPWLHQVARRVCAGARSAEVRRRRHEGRAAALAGPALQPDRRDDLDGQLHAEVGRLPAGCRSAVVLCYFEGLSPEQAARRLGCPVGTVQSRLARGRQRLRTRLARLGLAPASGAWPAAGTWFPPLPPPGAALVQATVRAGLRPAVASPLAFHLARGALRPMILTKLAAVSASICTAGALAAALAGLLPGAARPRDQAPDPPAADAPKSPPARPPGAPAAATSPLAGLAWAVVPPAERLAAVERLAERTRANHAKIRTWEGSYSSVLRQYLDARFVAELLAAPNAGGRPPAAPPGPLVQEFESTLTFAIDAADAIYRDEVARRMRFLRPDTGEEVKIPHVGTADHRSILTPTLYLFFRPNERATSSFLPNLPEARDKRRVDQFPVAEARLHDGGTLDPRAFFGFDAVSTFWARQDLLARALRGDAGADQRRLAEGRVEVARADDPDGRWHRVRVEFGNPGQPSLFTTTYWSPRAGDNPVRSVTTRTAPDGPVEAETDWQWAEIAGIFVPSTVHEVVRAGPGGPATRDLRATLEPCTLNQPLPPHQFDALGLDLRDGDLILDHARRWASIVRGGVPVPFAEFGASSILQPGPAPAPPAGPAAPAKGRIYTVANLRTDNSGRPVASVVAIDPATGAVDPAFDGAPHRMRLAPGGGRGAFVSGEWWSNLPPGERMRPSLWVRPLRADARPERLARLDGEAGGDVPVWSGDGTQLIVSLGRHDEANKRWINATFRINADGSGRVPLPIPAEDTVQDWSPDGAWLVVATSRGAKIGWQLDLMHPDGTEVRRLTEGGNPFYARFAPDGRRLVYTDGPQPDRAGIWVVDLDGANRRRILATGRGTASACWSPDGRQLAVAIEGRQPGERGRIEVVDLDGTHRTLLTMPGVEVADMPDWR